MGTDAVHVAPRGQRARVDTSDAGFTIIEVVAALFLVAVGFAATMSVFWSDLRTAGVSQFRSAGATVATKETEAVHAVPYDSVGFYSDQSGYVTQFEGRNTVTLGTTAPAGALAPTSVVPVGPITYSVARYVTWADTDPGSGNQPEAYKKTTVIVSWSDQGGSHQVRQDSVFYPGGRLPYAGPGSGSSTTTSTSSTTTSTSSTTTSTSTTSTTTNPCNPGGYSVKEHGTGATRVFLDSNNNGNTTAPIDMAVAVGGACADRYTVRVWQESNPSIDKFSVALSGSGGNLSGSLPSGTSLSTGNHIFQLHHGADAPGGDDVSGFTATILVCPKNGGGNACK